MMRVLIDKANSFRETLAKRKSTKGDLEERVKKLKKQPNELF